MLLYDLADPVELQGFVREVLREETENRFRLNEFLPNVDIDDIEYRITTGDLTDQDATVYRAFDTEAPIAKRQGISRIMGEIPPLSRKIPIGEEERLRIRQLETGDATPLVNAIYNDARNLARSIAARLEMARGELLSTGKVEINENGLQATVDFGRTLVPTAPSTSWDDPAATILSDMLTMVEEYADANGGLTPAAFVVGKVLRSHMLRNDELRTYAASLAGTPELITLGQLGNVLDNFDLPPIVVYDTSVRVNGTSTRVLASDKVLMVPPADEPMGRTLFGTTAEAIQLVGARQISADAAPGITAVVQQTFDPVKTWTKVAAIALPVLGNANLAAAVDVLF